MFLIGESKNSTLDIDLFDVMMKSEVDRAGCH